MSSLGELQNHFELATDGGRDDSHGGRSEDCVPDGKLGKSAAELGRVGPEAGKSENPLGPSRPEELRVQGKLARRVPLGGATDSDETRRLARSAPHNAKR